MQAALRITTRVLPGNRVEVSAPQLKEGETVDVIVVLPEPAVSDPSPPRRSMLDLIQSLPPGPRSAASWEDVERNLQADRDSWDR